MTSTERRERERWDAETALRIEADYEAHEDHESYTVSCWICVERKLESEHENGEHKECGNGEARECDYCQADHGEHANGISWTNQGYLDCCFCESNWYRMQNQPQ
jgi:hypothetical protein